MHINKIVRVTCALNNYLMLTMSQAYVPPDSPDSEDIENGTVHIDLTSKNNSNILYKGLISLEIYHFIVNKKNKFH